MDMQFTYTVFWNGREDEQEVMGLEGVQAIATNEFTEEEWLPEAIRSLQRVRAAPAAALPHARPPLNVYTLQPPVLKPFGGSRGRPSQSQAD